jgi:phage gp29-like protein
MKRPIVHREIATTGDGQDITRGMNAGLMLPYDKVLRNRGGGNLEIYEAVLSEPQVESTFQQRRRAVTKCEWRVEPASDRRADKKAATFLEQQLRKIGWDMRTERMLYGVFYGYAVAEIIYGRDGDMLTFEAIKVRNRRRFRFDADSRLRLLTYANMTEGELAEAPYFWHFATGADNDDEPYGLGLAHWCYWPVLFKRNGLKFWLIFCEKFGQPTAVGKYASGATDVERANLLSAIRAIQTDSGIIVPEGMMVELLEAARSGTADYKTLHDTMDETIAKITLGQTLTSNVGQGGGNRALGEVHRDVRQDLVKADADLVNESFNLGPATWLTRFNFPDADPPRVVRELEEPEDLTDRAEREAKIFQMGFKPTLEYIQETYGGEWEEKELPEPLDGAAPGAPGAAAAAAAGGEPAPKQTADDPDFADPDPNADVLAGLLANTEAAIAPEVEGLVGQVRELLEQAGDLTTFRERLVALTGSLPLAAFQEVMAQALTAGHLGGRAAVLEEVGRDAGGGSGGVGQ